jgi:hypothetical protein
MLNDDVRSTLNSGKKIKIMLFFAGISGLFVLPASLIFQSKFLIFPSLLIGFFLPFFILLEYDMDRMMKGLCVILYGIFWGIMMPEILEKYVPTQLMPNWEVFKNLAIFACSGAGGSIIASHVEQGYKKGEEQLNSEIVVDKTRQIEALIHSVESLKRTNLIINVIYGVFLLLGVFLFII